MKSQVAAEIAAAASLARSGWRPARGELLIVAVVDEETGGSLGAEWITSEPPGEGALRPARQRGRRRGVRVRRQAPLRRVLRGEGRVPLHACTTDGVAGHASMPGMGENALLKMGPVLERLARTPALLPPDRRAARVPARDRRGPRGPGGLDRAPARRRPAPGDDVRADARRDVHAHADQRLGEDQRDPQPRRAEGRLPRAARASASRRCARASRRCSATEDGRGLADRVHRARGRQPLAGRIAADGHDRGVDRRAATRAREVVPVILPGFTDSRHFRLAFPECVAYGFFPQRHQSLLRWARR